MSGEPFQFKPIDLDEHAELCVKFRLDSYVCSFGTTERFYNRFISEQGYVDWLRKRTQEMPGSCVHLWQHDQIIGQLEIGQTRDGPGIGYVELFYLAQDVRGSGAGQRLDEYVCDFFADLHFQRARLNVSLSNDRAIRYYEKQGWNNLGPDPRHSGVLLLEKAFPNA